VPHVPDNNAGMPDFCLDLDSFYFAEFNTTNQITKLKRYQIPIQKRFSQVKKNEALQL